MTHPTPPAIKHNAAWNLEQAHLIAANIGSQFNKKIQINQWKDHLIIFLSDSEK